MSLDIYLVKDKEEVYWRNITHNLNKMADEAGIYQAMWRPEEIRAEYAKDLIVPLSLGYKKLISNPSYYRKFNPKNGWGTYEGLVRFVKDYLVNCIEHPESLIEISR